MKSIEGYEGEMVNPVPIPRVYGGESDAKIIIGS